MQQITSRNAGTLDKHVPLAVTTRGGEIESVHFGSIAVVDYEGRLLWYCGNPDWRTFSRSCCKPLQAMPLVSHPDFESLGLSLSELAIMCGSHSGEERHARTVRGILAKINCREDDLQCGIQPPLYLQALDRPPAAGESFSPLQHNCSGMHAGMLALCRLLDEPIGDYLQLQHPVQQLIKRSVAVFTGVVEEAMAVGIDG